VPWGEGIGRLVNMAFTEEPVPVSFIVSSFNRDVVIRNQITTMLPRENIADILTAKADIREWLDSEIPAH
jgi:hypothetical protein